MVKKKHRSWKHQNLLHIILGIVIAVLLSKNATFHEFVLHLGSFSYLGAFIAGALFVSILTIGIATIILATLSQQISPILLAVIAGAGAVVGDYLIMHFINDNLEEELKENLNRGQLHKLNHLFHTKYFNWILPVIGAIIIASPLPDELGVSLMGLAKMNTVQFIVLSYILNSIGIAILIFAGLAFRP
ncbi:hypothetical protein HY948_03110 [Candidatus Gottesmanbacteria bacterium]|nr:hypothetical protein [Candidatus Gottesmanbacteria bacterium]